jgi:hypothetical protein
MPAMRGDEPPPRPLLLVADEVRTFTEGRPTARAVLVDSGRIVWVGDTERSAPTTREPPERVDLTGAWLQPAFVDAHAHLTATGLSLSGLDLGDCRCVDDCLAAVRAVVDVIPGRVVWGSGWDEFRWPEQRPPSAEELSEAAGGRPVFLGRADGHSSVMDRTSIESAPLWHLDGVERAAGGRPSGVLRREAHAVARRWFLAELPPVQLADARAAAAAHAASLGIASVHEMGGPDGLGEEDFDVWRTGRWPIEVRCYWGGADLDFVAARGLRCVGGALHLDGTIGSRTAALREAYADSPTRGRLYRDTDELVGFTTAAVRRKLQVAFHCIGDRAVEQAVEVLQRVVATVGAEEVRRTRPRLEHAALLPTELIPRLADVGAVASVQPGYDRRWGGDGGLYAHRLGPARAAATNPLRGLVDGGVPVALGSDTDVTSMDPWATIAAATDHHEPSQALDEVTATACAVLGGRHAAHQDDVGRILPGQRADLAAFTPGRKCVLTIVKGGIVHRIVA